MIYEIRMHGRGGQGVVLAASILADALVRQGQYCVAVPSFGFERRGAPVAAYLRVSDREIRQLTNIYTPHCVLCVDPTLGRAVDIFAGVRDGGVLVQATAKPLAELTLAPQIASVGLCDAVGIALGIFRRPITNTVMLGALARATGVVQLAALEEAVRDSDFRDAGLRQNLEALKRGFEETTVHQVRHEAAA